MKILVLTSTDSDGTTSTDSDGIKVYLIIDKIVAYHKTCVGSTVVKTTDGSWFYVKESPEFITNQLVDANANSYVVYNSEERK